MHPDTDHRRPRPLTFKRALGANALASSSGLAMQAATAPLLLLAFRVDQYAQWILVTAICSYLSLALNGVFFAILNEITHAAAAGRRDEAARLYAAGFAAIGSLLTGALLCLAGAEAVGAETLGAGATPLCLGLIVQAVGFATILFDAGFRAADQYARGTNLLTLGRVTDWLAAIGLAFLTRDVTAAFAWLALYRIVLTLAGAMWLATRRGGLAPTWAIPTRRDVRRLAQAARGQVVLSATNAASVMGPQIVVATLYDSATVVMFTTARTYLRLLAAGANVLTAAAWPLFGAMHARRDVAAMRDLLSTLLVRTIGLATVTGLALVAVSGPVFALAFRGTVEPVPPIMLLILASVVVNCAVSIEQSVFVATNLRARALGLSLVVTLAEIAFMAVGSRFLPLAAVLGGAVVFDVAVLGIVHRAVGTVLSARSTVSGGRGRAPAR